MLKDVSETDPTPSPILPSRARLAATALLGLSACMASPTDLQVVSSRTTPITFQGYSFSANQAVDFSAFDTVSNDFVAIGSVRTANSGLTFDGTTWYSYEGTASIGRRQWRSGLKGGDFARVKSNVGNVSFISVVPNINACASANPSVAAIFANCDSIHSPEAYIFTSSYPTTPDIVVTSLSFSPRGTTVRVTNAGRDALVSRIQCTTFGRAVVRTIGDNFLPGQSRTYTVGLVPGRGQSVECVALSEDLDGNPECTSFNSRSPNPASRCADNSRSRRFF